jgi:glycosyltransferase involved in cell wall biosynthesis
MIHPHDIFSPNEPWTIRIVSLAGELSRRGHQVKLAYCPLEANEEKGVIDLKNIEIVSLSRRVGINNLLSNIRKLLGIAKWADIIHFQKCFHYVSIPAIILAWHFNKPLHYDWDDWEEKIWYHSNKKSLHTVLFGNYIRLIERTLPVLADTVSVSSHKLEELCVSFGVERNRIFKVPVGADLEKFGPHVCGESVRQKYHLKKKTVVLYAGQLHGGQYVKMFIEAANIVLPRCRESIFLIVGQGYMLLQLKELAKRLGIKDGVIFTGSIPHGLVSQYISVSDICVASFEHNEVTMCKSPLKIAEYLASGKPIVASLVGETRNMVGGAGMLVEPGNYRALAEAIISLLKDPQLRQEMGYRARRRAESRYNWRCITENLLEAYEISSPA